MSIKNVYVMTVMSMIYFLCGTGQFRSFFTVLNINGFVNIFVDWVGYLVLKFYRHCDMVSCNILILTN